MLFSIFLDGEDWEIKPAIFSVRVQLFNLLLKNDVCRLLGLTVLNRVLSDYMPFKEQVAISL